MPLLNPFTFFCLFADLAAVLFFFSLLSVFQDYLLSENLVFRRLAFEFKIQIKFIESRLLFSDFLEE